MINLSGKFNESMLNEAKQVGVIYHYTELSSFFRILETNTLRGLISKYSKGISFTRNKNFHKSSNRYIMGIDVSFVVDGNKLSNNYKIVPFQDLLTKKDIIDQKLKWEKEDEEVVTSKEIKNFLNYVIGFRLHKKYDLSKLNSSEYSYANSLFVNTKNTNIPQTEQGLINAIESEFKIKYLK